MTGKQNVERLCKKFGWAITGTCATSGSVQVTERLVRTRVAFARSDMVLTMCACDTATVTTKMDATQRLQQSCEDPATLCPGL